MESKARRNGYNLGILIGALVGYVLFIITSPVMGIFVVWDWVKNHRAENVIFANFKKSR